LIPQINLLGHQSWESQIGKLLEVYPQFDETPSILLPTEYKWPMQMVYIAKVTAPSIQKFTKLFLM